MRHVFLLTSASPALLSAGEGLHPGSLAGGAALIIVGLLVLLYLQRRRQYILYWIAGWSCHAAAMLVAAGAAGAGADAGTGAAAYGLSQLLSVGSALFFVGAAAAFAGRPRVGRRLLLFLIPVALWLLGAPLALGPAGAFVPGHLLAAAALTLAAAGHLRILRDHRLLGAGIVGLMLLVTAGLNVWDAVDAGPRAGLPSGTFLVELALLLLGALGMQLMTFEDMTSELRRANGGLEAAQAQLRQMVVTDALTGCRNRRFFDEVIARELNSHRRYGTPLSILFIDVDRFKTVNDSLGHEAGDQVLREVAAFLMRKTRDADYVFRWGGDEFLLLLSCREEEARRRGEALRREFAAAPAVRGRPHDIGLSVGCAEVPLDAESVADTLKLADERMYSSKRGARVEQMAG